MKKKYKVILVFGLIVIFLICGYFFRLDRFGFTNIHWVDFLEYKNELYVAVTNNDSSLLAVNDSEIGDKIGEVKYTLQGNVRNTYYKYRNFDASILETGTLIYRMKGENNADKLAVYMDGFYYLYQLKSEVSVN